MSKPFGNRYRINVSSSAPLAPLADGTEAVPAFAFNSDPDTGLYRTASELNGDGTTSIGLGISTNGVKRMKLDDASVFVTGKQYIAGATKIADATVSTTPTTGALVVTGGLGIGERTYTTGNINSTSTFLVTGGGNASSPHIQVGASGYGLVRYSNSAVGVAAGSVDALRVNTAGNVEALITTDTTSGTTGAIICDGGLGVAKNLYVGTTSTVADVTDSTSTTTGARKCAGGVSAEKNIHVGTAIRTWSTADSASTSTGAIICDGGVGVVKKGYFGGALTVADGTASTTSTTGALIVTGGMGVAGGSGTTAGMNTTGTTNIAGRYTSTYAGSSASVNYELGSGYGLWKNSTNLSVAAGSVEMFKVASPGYIQAVVGTFIRSTADYTGGGVGAVTTSAAEFFTVDANTDLEVATIGRELTIFNNSSPSVSITPDGTDVIYSGGITVSPFVIAGYRAATFTCLEVGIWSVTYSI